MFLRGSRYEKNRRFDPSDRFEGVRPRDIPDTEGAIEHVIKAGDRLDHLARHYYNNDRLWWRILDANPDVLYGGDLNLEKHHGEVILIPRARG